MAFLTAFQPNAFQNNAFQIMASGRSLRGGRTYRSRKEYERYLQRQREIDDAQRLELAEERALIQARKDALEAEAQQLLDDASATIQQLYGEYIQPIEANIPRLLFKLREAPARIERVEAEKVVEFRSRKPTAIEAVFAQSPTLDNVLGFSGQTTVRAKVPDVEEIALMVEALEAFIEGEEI